MILINEVKEDFPEVIIDMENKGKDSQITTLETIKIVDINHYLKIMITREIVSVMLADILQDISTNYSIIYIRETQSNVLFVDQTISTIKICKK